MSQSMTIEKKPVSSAPKSGPAAPALLFPFLDLKAQHAHIREEVYEAVHRILESQHFILGSEVEALESEVAKLANSKFAVGCASGSDALLLSLMALDVDQDDEVVTVPFTFSATAGMIARQKARPVFVDIDPRTYNLDVTKLSAAVTSRTRAIMPVHLFGLAADLREIMAIAGEHKLPVIEDAAQAIGATYAGRPVGSFGSTGCFSFFPSKNLGGAGDGGMITTQDAALAERLKILRGHGTRTKYNCEQIGINSRLDALQAAILRVKMKHLSDWSDSRRNNADRYRARFQDRGLDQILGLPFCPDQSGHVYNQFVIRVPERDELRQHLRSAGIPTEVYYPYPLHMQPAFAYLGYREGDFPETERACREVLALPVFPELTESQQNMVVDTIAKFYA
ncbi:MAG: DegT/DnrJ/EryC1/StrS family aminotransferase [Terriglobales bacterium]